MYIFVAIRTVYAFEGEVLRDTYTTINTCRENSLLWYEGMSMVIMSSV